MNFLARRRRKRRELKRQIEELWSPAYEALARYNSEASRGIMHTPAVRNHMERIQRDYKEYYLPTVRRLEDEIANL